MGKLPKINTYHRTTESYQVSFGGINHTEGANDGDIYDMTNMASDHYPVLCPREKRKHIYEFLGYSGGAVAYDGALIYAERGYVHGDERTSAIKIYKDGEIYWAGDASDTEKIFVPFRDSVIIFPDKIMIPMNGGETENLEASVTLPEAVFKAEGMLYGEAAENNTIYSPGFNFSLYFKEGDAVKIEGCSVGANNKTPIIREIYYDYLRFYENVFTTEITRYTYTVKETLSSASFGMLQVIPAYGFIKDGHVVAFELPQDALKGTYMEWETGAEIINIYFADETGVASETPTEVAVNAELSITKHLDFVGRNGDVTETNITISRTIPDMDFIIADDNRLWGAKGNTIYGSKLGDPTNFNVFDGLSTDSYSVDIGNAGDITAALNYNGYPTFFKEDGIYRLYGDRPSNYQIMPTMKQGVKKGCHKSMAVAGEVLYYISTNGIMAYAGGIPTKADLALGKNIIDGVAVSDGMKYYISATEDGENYSLYVYDTVRNLWHKEDDTKIEYAACENTVFLLTEHDIYAMGRHEYGTEEDDVEWMVEFADITFGSPYQKGVIRAHIRFDLEPNAEAKAEISYDGGEWEMIREFRGNGKRSNVLPVIPHRCDHFKIRLSGTGICDIYSMALQYYNGSDKY